MGAATVEDIAATIAALVLGNATAVRETEDAHHQRAAAVVLREGGGAVLGMGGIDIGVGRAEPVGAVGRRLADTGKGGQVGKPPEHIHHVGIGESVAQLEQLAQVVDSRGDAVDKVALALEVAAEAVGP